MTATTPETFDHEPVAEGTVLDRSIDLGVLSWTTVAWVATLAVALALRLARIDLWALAPEEARRAFDAWLFYRGQPPLPGQPLPTTGPLFLLLQAFGFFLFGTTDLTARLLPALAGFALVALVLALRPFVGRPAALGMAALAAVSPTLVYASRVATPEIVIACLSLLLVVAVLRAGREGADASSTRRWAAASGVTLGALLATGPSAITVLISLGVGAGVAAVLDRRGAVRQGLGALARIPGALLIGLAALVATVLVLFTRLFSDPGAIAGLGQTFVAWGRLLGDSSVGTPTQFFLLALLLYEPLAVLMAIVVAVRGRVPAPGGLGGAFFAGWFAAALLLWSFSSGRAPGDAVHVALPLVLLGGAALGEVVAAADWRDVWGGVGGGLALAMLGFIVGLIALGILAGRTQDVFAGRAAVLPAVVVAMLVVVPLAYAVWLLSRTERLMGRPRQPGVLALLVVSLLLAMFTLRSAVLLSFYRADEGTELLAQGTATAAVLPMVEGLEHLSRDMTLTDGSVRDTTGGHGLTIAVDGSVRWPFEWYFREFPDLSVVDPGQALLAQAQVVIAPDDAGMAEAGYTPRDYPWLNRVPPAYAAPDVGGIVRAVVSPSRWIDGARFLLYREGVTPGDPETVAVGLNQELAARVYPSTGPYNLSDRPGPGSGRGQFNQPVGIAAAPDGTIYVVDQGNARVERFDADGAFVGIWGGGEEGNLTLARTPNGLGPTGIAVGSDGLIYVADTWNHRVVVLDPDGDVIREIGGPPDASGLRVAADTGDNPAGVDSKTGLFFGPRAVAATDDEIYVVDTGNERVQVFAKDGTFRRVWGGYGHGPGQLIEPVGIAIGDDGLVYVADSGNARISVFTGLGQPVAQWPVAAWPTPDPGGARPSFQPYLAFGPDGNLYATSSDDGSVEVIDRTGKLVRSITDVGGDPLRQPLGIAVDPNGELLITDVGRDAVYRYTPPVAPAPAEVNLPPQANASPPAADGAAAPTSRSIPPPPASQG